VYTQAYFGRGNTRGEGFLGEICFVLDTCVNNLRYARLDVPEAECIEVTKRANAQEFILRLPDG